MDQRSAKDLTAEWFERVWNRGEEDAISELLAADCEVAGLDEKGPASFLPLWRRFQAAFEGISVQVLELAADGRLVAGVVDFSARHVATAKEVSFPIGIVAEWERGKIVRARNVLDFATLLMQLELLDPALLEEVFAS